MNAHSSPHKTDKQKLTDAIDAACADLQALKARIHNSSVRTMEMQVESFEAYEDYARDIIGFTNDLRVTAIVVAASLGNQDLSRSDVQGLRATDRADDIFADAHSWCDEVREEMEAA